MALNIATFKTRALTSLFFVLIMLAGMLWNQWSFFILFSIIHFGCWLEYQKLVGLIDKDYAQITPFHKYGVMIAGWCIMLYFTNDSFTIFGLRLHALGWWLGLLFVFILPIIELLFAKHIQLKNIGYSSLGLLYISLSLGLMMDLRTRFGFEYGKEFWNKALPLGLVLALWANDTFAYLVGSFIGKTPFSRISPKKTWEGTVGGIVLCIVGISLVFGLWWNILSITDWIFISAIAAITGTAGDLLESKIKRMANVKDSGHLMPGHGGFLDRFDSLIVATPFVWLYVVLFVA